MGFYIKLRTYLSGASKYCCGTFVYQLVSTSNNGLKKMGGRFRSYVWDPALIISQIIALQCVFYFTIGTVTAGLLAMIGSHPSLQHIFDSQSVHIGARENQLLIVSHVLNSIFGSLALWYIIQRAKQCLDFTCTLHLIHFILCWIYTRHFPTSVTWWLVQLVCIVLMVVIGEYLCMRSDMKDIPVIGARAHV